MFSSFPVRKDAIFSSLSNSLNSIEIASSGSIGQYYDSKCHLTNPNQTVLQDNQRTDWCSNIAKTSSDKPWITYNIKGKSMSVTGFTVRAGCCYYGCCCIDDNTDVYGCCCDLYSFSLHGSNDNKMWKLIHSVKKEKDVRFCKHKTYEFPKTESFRYIKFVQDEPYPDCTFCMAINKFELYGTLSDSRYESLFDDDSDNDESVSIIGKLPANHV